MPSLKGAVNPKDTKLDRKLELRRQSEHSFATCLARTLQVGLRATAPGVNRRSAQSLLWPHSMFAKRKQSGANQRPAEALLWQLRVLGQRTRRAVETRLASLSLGLSRVPAATRPCTPPQPDILSARHEPQEAAEVD